MKIVERVKKCNVSVKKMNLCGKWRWINSNIKKRMIIWQNINKKYRKAKSLNLVKVDQLIKYKVIFSSRSSSL